MKLERFITEYANYQIRSINNNNLMKEDIKKESLYKIDKALKLRKRGLITVAETMSILSSI